MAIVPLIRAKGQFNKPEVERMRMGPQGSSASRPAPHVLVDAIAAASTQIRENIDALIDTLGDEKAPVPAGDDPQAGEVLATPPREQSTNGKSSLSGSENRKLSAIFAMRMSAEERAMLDQAAVENGFKDAKALVMFRLRDDLGGLERVS